MIEVCLGQTSSPPQHILCLGAHCDDIEIGAGGTVLKLQQLYPAARFHWVVFSSEPVRAAEAQRSAERFLANASTKTVIIKDFRTSFLPYEWKEVKETFEQLKSQCTPDLILTHYRDDLHQDHRVVCELTWNTFRNHLILEYEIPKYDGDMGTPNFFVSINERQREQKIATILDCFASQSDKAWFTADTFRALMRLRGIECNAPGGHAEAFYCRKMIL